jgi:predicted glycoside hydrolase/deacetylase ChbG (UPF0249 family)
LYKIVAMKRKILNNILRLIRRIFFKSIQNRLGYPENSILLIIHADDIGLTESENLASFEAMERGMVNSGSIMVPCRGFSQVVDYVKTNPGSDLGIHFTLTSEWDSYKWGPVSKPDQIASIVDQNGNFLESASKLIENFKVEDIRKELKSQITLALESGIDLTHIDSHMFTVFSNKVIQKAYADIGMEYKLPMLLTIDNVNSFSLIKNNVIVDYLYYAQPKHNVQDLSAYYRQVLYNMKPGLNTILLHVAYNNSDMQSITNNTPKYGSEWRQADFDFFAGDECRQIVKDRNIQIVSWREIRDKLVR